MLRLAVILSALAFPAAAQTSGDCKGIPDGLAWLAENDFRNMGNGTADVGIIAVYARPDGAFLLVLFGQGLACIKAKGMGWTVGPNA